MRLLYTVLLYLTLPVWLTTTAISARKRGTPPPRWAERFGFLKIPRLAVPSRIWVHAVSVGEVMVVTPILRAVRARLPGHEIVVSTTTTTGQAVAAGSLAGLADFVVYWPYDLPSACRRALRGSGVAAVVMAETELWPNFLAEAKRLGIKTLIANARLSDRSYVPARRFRRIYSAMLANVDRVLAQTPADAQRFVEVGARPETVTTAGNTKFEQALDAAQASEPDLRRSLGVPPDVPVIVVGSTRVSEDGDALEERYVLDAFERVSREMADVRLVIAPRHLERSDAILREAQGRGLAVCRKTQLPPDVAEYRVIVLDTFGELSAVYSVATVAVVGGGFANLGGQNILQPLAHGKPTIFGVHMHNFRDVAAEAVRLGIGFAVATPEELASRIIGLVRDPGQRERIAGVAVDLVRRNQGASERCAEAVAELLGES